MKIVPLLWMFLEPRCALAVVKIKESILTFFKVKKQVSNYTLERTICQTHKKKQELKVDPFGVHKLQTHGQRRWPDVVASTVAGG